MLSKFLINSQMLWWSHVFWNNL